MASEMVFNYSWPTLAIFADASRWKDINGSLETLVVASEGFCRRHPGVLALLEGEELTVAELSAITQLAQPRVSTHLAKLKDAGLCATAAPASLPIIALTIARLSPAVCALWHSISHGSDDPLLRQDAERVPARLAMRR